MGMPSTDPLLLPRRDAQGHFLEQPVWLRPGWQRVIAAGLGLGGWARKLCAHEGCRTVPVRGSDRCWHHDLNWRRKRRKELRSGRGKPMTPAESVRLFRADQKALWLRVPWWPAQTLWLAPALEAAFVEDCRRASLNPARTAPSVLNALRWAWRLHCLNHDDAQGWLRSLAAARKRQIRIGEPPAAYVFQPPADTPPTDARVKVVRHRPTAYEPAATNPVIERTTRSKQRRQRHAPIKTPADFDWRAFLIEHWTTLFRQLFAAYRLDPRELDGEIGRRLAVTWRAILDERVQLGEGVCGAAYDRWIALLRQIPQDQH
jgi:hypothetical protein